MLFSKSITTVAVVAGFALAGSMAHGATHNPGTYDASNVTTRTNDHTFWLVDFLGDGDADRHWQFQDGSGVFVVDDDGASLNATIVQNTNANHIMNVSMDFVAIDGPGSMGNKCGGDCSDTSEWDYFDFTSAVVTGVGELAGVILNLEIYPIDEDGKPSMPGQLGWGANDKDAAFGFSTWFTWVEDEGSRDYAGRSGRGDANMQLTASPSEVPLPLPALMLISGLGALGMTRKLRKG